MPTSVYMVSKPAIASMMVDGGASSAPTVLVVGADEIVNQPSASPSESTQLILNPAASQGSAFPGSAPQDIPRLDSGITSSVDSARVNAFYTNHSSFVFVFSLYTSCKEKEVLCIVLRFYPLYIILFIYF